MLGGAEGQGVHVEQTTLKYLWSAPTYLVDQAHQHLLATAVPRQWDTSCMSVCDMISQSTYSLHLYPVLMALVEMKEKVGVGLGEFNLYTMAQQKKRSWQCQAVCWHHSNVYQYQTAMTSTMEAVTKASIVKGLSFER